jgi:hypothetical protein
MYVFHLLLVFSRRRCRFIASSDVKFLCFINLSTSFSHLTSGRPRRRLPTGDQVIVHLVHLLSSMRTTSPPYFNMFFFQFSPQHFLLPQFFSLITSFFIFSCLEVFAVPTQNPFLYLNSFLSLSLSLSLSLNVCIYIYIYIYIY